MPVGYAVAAVAGGYLASEGAKDAAQTQRGAAGDANQVTREMFDVSRAQQQPYMQSGYGANAELSRLLGIAPQTAAGNAPGTDRALSDLVHNRGGVPTPNAELYANNPAYRQAWDDTLKNEQATQRGWSGQSTYFMPGSNADFVRLSDSITRRMLDAESSGALPGVDERSGFRISPNGSIQRVPQVSPGATVDTTGSGPTGLPTGYLTQTFGPEQFRAGMDPGYQFRLQQGAQGVMNQAATAGSSLSGPALKALMEYNSGMASQEFGSAFDRFQTQQGNIFQRLMSLSALGQNAAAGVGNNAVATGATIGGNIVGAGNATAAGQIGSANAISGTLSDLGAAAYLTRPVK